MLYKQGGFDFPQFVDHLASFETQVARAKNPSVLSRKLQFTESLLRQNYLVKKHDTFLLFYEYELHFWQQKMVNSSTW